MRYLRRGALAAAAVLVAAVSLAGGASAYSTAPQFAATNFVTGLPNQGGNGVGPVGLAFDATDHLYVMDYANGHLYKYASDGTLLADLTTPFGNNNAAGIAFSKSGRLYVALQGWSQVDEINLSTGGIARTVAAGISCATGIATDPLSGDLVATSPCGGPLYRISHFEDGGPIGVTPFGQPGIDGLTFAPDGTMYGAYGGQYVMRLAGSNQPNFGQDTWLQYVPTADGTAVAASSDPTKPPYLFANRNNGIVTKLDLSGSPANNAAPATDIFTGGSRGDFSTVGPDGCLYITQTDRVVKITNADGTCSLAPTTVVPTLTLAPASATHHVGESDTVTAALSNVATKSGVQVTFTVTGANSASQTVATDANGVATFTYSGTNQGKDSVTATTTIGTQAVTSNAAAVTWLAPLDTTPPVITPILSGTAGTNGWWTSDVALHWDVSDPETGIASSTGCGDVTFTASGQATCTATNGVGLTSSVTETVQVDETPPAIVPTVTGTLGNEGWYTSPVGITWSVSDPESGIGSSTGCGPTTLSTDTASASVTCTATNVAGLSASQTQTVKIDQTPPVVTYSPHPAVYDVDATVSITCAASDAMSGVTVTTCADVSGSAWSFPLGTSTFSASATDHAGNVGNGSTSFRVVVTFSGLCNLTTRFSSKAGIATSLCAKLNAASAAAARGETATAENILGAYRNEVSAQTGKAFTGAEAATLIRLSQAL